MKLPTQHFFVSIQLILFILYIIPLCVLNFQLQPFARHIAFVFALIGLLIVFIAIIQLNKNLTPFPTPKENGTLIQTGLYKFVRHPIYSGIIITALSFGCYNGSLTKNRNWFCFVVTFLL